MHQLIINIIGFPIIIHFLINNFMLLGFNITIPNLVNLMSILNCYLLIINQFL